MIEFLCPDMIRLLSESPRWLVVKRKYAPARRIIGKMAAMNSKELPPDFDVSKIEVIKIKTSLKLFVHVTV